MRNPETFLFRKCPGEISGVFYKFVLTFLFFSYIIIIGGEYMITTISLPEVFMAKIREEAKKSGMSISEYIRYCVTRYWDEKRGE